MSSLFRLSVVLLLYTPGAAGQGDPITRVTVNQVRIDAVVTDSKGNLITSLQSEDFQVFQDGKRQNPIHVQYVAGPAPAASSPGRELKASDVTRTIVVFLDDADMSFESFVHARQAIRQYLEKQLQPGDLVAILRTTQGSSYLNPFISDPAALRLAIDQMRYYPPTLSQKFFHLVFPLLGSTLSALNRMPGRKSLVLFCDNMPINVQTDRPLEIYLQLADAALRSSVRIYGIDSRGLNAYSGADGPQAQIIGARPAEQAANQRINDALSPADANFPPRPSDPRLSLGAWMDAPNVPAPHPGDMDGLAFLSHETGGLMLENNNDLGAQLQKALGEQTGYYLIAWDPGEKAFQPQRGTFADFHNISVKLTRPGLKARTPQGFYGLDSGAPQLSRSPRMAMQEALLAPFQTGRFDTQMNSVFDTEGGRGYIRSYVYIGGKDIAFTPFADGPRKDCYAIHLEFLTLPQPVDASVEVLAESQITSLETCGTTYDAIAHNGLAVTMMHPVDKAGGYQMRLAVRNAEASDAVPSLPGRQTKLVTREEGERPVGSAHQLVMVPEWWSAPAVFGLHVQSEKLEASVVRPRMAGETDRNMTLAYRPAAPGDPAIRSFRPGEKLQYEAQIANVANPAAAIRITRADGDATTEIYAGRAETVHDGSVRGSYAIESTMAPGSYELQLIITGKAANDQPYRGVEAIDFDVQNQERASCCR